MRTLIIIFALALITSCRSHKDTQYISAATADSVARSDKHTSTAVIDSAFRISDFSFDTLSIVIEKPTSVTDSSLCNSPTLVRVKAVNGRVSNRRKAYRDSTTVYNALDTVAYHRSSARNSTAASDTSHIYNPPNTTAPIIIAIIIIAVLIYLFGRKK